MPATSRPGSRRRSGFRRRTFPLEEIFWATRKFFETQADRQPLVVAFEDIHWAEPALLDLIEYLAATVSGVPLLVLCAARPDLLDLRPDWADQAGELIELAPLSREESTKVIDNVIGHAPLPVSVRDRVVAVAEGNPLFVEQLLSMLIDDGALRREGGGWVAAGDLSELAIPGTIQALLSARLDLLSSEERVVVESASVIGLFFARAAVEHLAGLGSAAAEQHLRSMTAKQLVRPDMSQVEADYRFHHILVRDAAYLGILKRARASMHERFADWAERVNRERGRESSSRRSSATTSSRHTGISPSWGRSTTTESSSAAGRPEISPVPGTVPSRGVTWRRRRTSCGGRASCWQRATPIAFGSSRTWPRR